MPVLFGDKARPRYMFFRKLPPFVPVTTIRDIKKHYWLQVRFACLDQSHCLKPFIHRAKSSWEQGYPAGLLYKKYFPGKEVPEIDQFWVISYVRVSPLLKREGDIQAKAVVPPCPALGCLHNPWASAGYHHKTLFHYAPGKIYGHFVGRGIRDSPGRAENCYLFNILIFAENLKTV